MTRKLLVVAAFAVCATVAAPAHAIPEKAFGTVIAEGPSLAAGTLGEGSPVVATYTDSTGWHRFDDGEVDLLTDDPSALVGQLETWVTSDGGVFVSIIDPQSPGIHYAPRGGSLAKIAAVGDPCPIVGQITELRSKFLDSNTSFIAEVVCTSAALGAETGFYRYDVGGGAALLAKQGMEVEGFEGSDEPAVISNFFLGAGRSGPGRITFAANVFCAGDPQCPTPAAWAGYEATAAGAPSLVFSPAQRIPGLPAAYDGGFGQVFSNDSGDLLIFSGTTVAQPDPPALFVVPHGGAARRVVTLGDKPSGADAELLQFGTIQIDARGFAAFTTRTDINGKFTLWQESAAGIGIVLQPGGILPGTPGDGIEELVDWRVSPTGRIAAIAKTTGGVYGEQVLLAQDDNRDLQVVWTPRVVGGLEIPIQTPTGEVNPEGLMSFGGNTPGGFTSNGVDGLGSGFTSFDRLLVTILPKTGNLSDFIIAFDLDDAPPALPEVQLEFVVTNAVPFRWSDELNFEAVVLNTSTEPVTDALLTVEFDPAVRRLPVPTGCTALAEDESKDELSKISCDTDLSVPAFGEARFAFTVDSPDRKFDGNLTLKGTVDTTHDSGPKGEANVESSFSLLATPEVADLRFTLLPGEDGETLALVVQNDGPSTADNVVFTATLVGDDGEFGTYDDANNPREDCTLSADERVGTCTLEALAPGDTGLFFLPYDSKGVAKVEVASDDEDPDLSNNTATVNIQPVESACSDTQQRAADLSNGPRLTPICVPEDDGGGGGCRVGAVPSSGGFALLLLALAARYRRRRG